MAEMRAMPNIGSPLVTNLFSKNDASQVCLDRGCSEVLIVR
jgi:hypothetical protein